MVEGRDRRVELGYFKAMRLKDQNKECCTITGENGGTNDCSPDDVSSTPRDPVIFLT